MTARKPNDAYARARRRQLDRSPDRFVRATNRYAERGLAVCDCPCHWWPDVHERMPCCRNRGLRWAGDGFVPWGGEEDD
jgi:hypothetical protein